VGRKAGIVQERRDGGNAREKALENNAKIVVPAGVDLVAVLGEMAGVVPIVRADVSVKQ